MSISLRNYTGPDDYWRIDQFLLKHYQPNNADGNWIEPAWEYMNFHSMLDSSSLDKIGIWEDSGEIVAVAHYEWRLGEAFFQFHPAYRHLRGELLDYAEKNLYGRSQEEDKKYLCAFINDNDTELLALVRARGYEMDSGGNRPMSGFLIPNPFPPIKLPAGFRLISLAEECRWEKVHRVLWRGFDHEGEPPVGEDWLEDRRKMFDTPSGRRDLKIAVEAPNGNYVSFCGMFYEPNHQYAYVEPVATDPEYRRMGLGKAAVMEGIRRCGAFGATMAYVGSDQGFYLSMGFKVIYTSQCWVKHFDEVQK